MPEDKIHALLISSSLMPGTLSKCSLNSLWIPEALVTKQRVRWPQPDCFWRSPTMMVPRTALDPLGHLQKHCPHSPLCPD